MNTYPPEWETSQGQPPEHELPPEAPARWQPPPPEPPRPVRRGGDGLCRLALGISAAALIVAGAALLLTLWPEKEPAPAPAPPEPPGPCQFGGQTQTPREGMPLTPYDRSAFVVDSRGRVLYEKDGKTAKTGVDVSTYQGEVDWQAVAADGIDFAILRLGYRGYTEGGLFMDESFSRNLQGALDAGLEVGVYFFSQAITPEEAEAEAAYILNAIDGSPSPRAATPAPRAWTGRR